jgi:WhiB family redox-sensing transcriptional regulator
VNEQWTKSAACAQIGGDFWFPEKGDFANDAKQICSGCPVRAECLEYALDNKIQEGVWGGVNARARRDLARHRREAA